jgi:HEAT repeat protein
VNTDIVAESLRHVAPEGVDGFVDLLAAETDRRARTRMADTLTRAGAAVIPALLPHLADERWFVVRNMLYIIGKIGQAPVPGPVVTALGHSHPRVRLEAVRTISLIGGEDTIGVRLRYVNDPDPTVRWTTIGSLGIPGNDQATATLRDVLKAPRGRGGDPEAKREAIRALTAIGTPGAIAALKAAGGKVWVWRRTQRELRSAAAKAAIALEAGRGH